MGEMLTVCLSRPIRTAQPAPASGTGPPTQEPPRDIESAEQSSAIPQSERARLQAEVERGHSELAQTRAAIDAVLTKLDEVHRETLAGNRAEIARLAVEIARKILMVKVKKGDYDIQAVIEEALRRAPARQNIAIRLHPDDLGLCQKLQQANPDSPFADLAFTADWSVGRGECLVETPKGIVRSFIEEHLERIGEALENVE
jgi:flagellar biosynthesis/type III secretory pathway protein FliH